MDIEFTGLIDTWVERVYRFHLARRGDWLEAETLTAQTFLDAYLGRVRDPVGLMRLALARQAQNRSGAGRRSDSGDTVSLENPVPPAHSVSDGLPTRQPFLDDDMEQERLLQRARITALKDYWTQLEPAQADVLALACFAGLDLATISRALRVSSVRVTAWLETQAEIAPQLAKLGNAIQIPDLFITELKVALSQVSPTHWTQRWLEQTRLWFTGLTYSPRGGLGQLTRLALVGLVIVLAGFGLWSTIHQERRPLPTPTPKMQQTATPAPVLNLQAVGALMPPDQTVCQQWRDRLLTMVGGSVTLSPSSTFSDPAGSGPDYYGKGCFITINTAETPGDHAVALRVKQVLDALSKESFKQTKAFPAQLNLPDSATGKLVLYQGQGYSFSRQNDQVVFEWLTDTNGSAYPPSSDIGEHVIVYFGLATRSAMPVVQGFIGAWASGSASTNTFLSTELRQKLPDLASLDRLAGITRSGTANLTIDWKLVENQGDSLRLSLSLSQISQLALPSSPINPVQILLQRENGQLKISELASGVLFNPSGDALVLVDAQGQLYTLSLDNGQRTNLSDTGFYPLSKPSTDQEPRSIPPPTISPDGQWLFIERPDDDMTYLFRMDGKRIMTLGYRPVIFNWAPKSSKFAFVTSDIPNRLIVGQANNGYLTSALASGLASTPGPIRAAAWSPLGDWIGLAYEDSGKLDLARVSLADNGYLDPVWSTPWNGGSDLPPGALAWTADQNELWFMPSRISIHFEDRTAYLLMDRPDDQITEDLLATSLGEKASSAGPAVLSPDGNWFAQVVDNPSTTALFTGNFWVKLRPANRLNIKPEFLFAPNVKQLAWAGNSQSLIEIKSQTGPAKGLVFDKEGSGNGLVFTRLNPVTQEEAQVIEETPARVFLGLTSALLTTSKPTLPQADVNRIPLPAEAADQYWVGIPSEVLNLSMSFPNGWSYYPPQHPDSIGTISMVIANFTFNSPTGFVSLRRGDVTVRITRTPYESGQSPADWLATQTHQAFTTEAFKIGGQQAYWAMRANTDSFFKSVLFTTPNAGYTIEWYSFTPDTDTLVDRILESIQLK